MDILTFLNSKAMYAILLLIAGTIYFVNRIRNRRKYKR